MEELEGQPIQGIEAIGPTQETSSGGASTADGTSEERLTQEARAANRKRGDGGYIPSIEGMGRCFRWIQ